MMLAAQEGNLGSVKLLHERGARLNEVDNDGNHSLIYILRKLDAVLYSDVIEYLLDSDVNPFIENKAGDSVDDFVAALHSLSVYKLVDKAQKNYSENKKGHVPEHLRYLSKVPKPIVA